MKRQLLALLLLSGAAHAQITHPGYIGTVAGLPACTAGRDGRIAGITDATSMTVLGAGGGSATTVVVCDGTTWTPLSDGAGGGSPVAVDLTNDSVDEIVDLIRINTTGDTNSIFTESPTDELLINAGLNWPSADTATALAANGANCSAGNYPLGVDASGAVESCTPVGGAPTDADYLVGTANVTLTAEIVVGTSPGGELGGTWAAPTLDDGVSVTTWDLGASTATTPAADDNDTSLATTAYVQGEIDGAGGTNLTCSGGACNVDDVFVLVAGDTMTGNLAMNDGVGDSPVISFVPQTSAGGGWGIRANDASDDLEIQTGATGAVEQVVISNPGAGTADLSVDGQFLGGGVTSGADPGHSHTAAGSSVTIDAADITDQHGGTDITADLEEEGQINATAVTGNAADDQVLLGSGASAISYATIPDCNSNNMLTYTQSTNTWGCDADDGAGGGAPVGVQYVVGASDATLTAEKILTDGQGIDTVITGGDAGAATIDLDYTSTLAGDPAFSAEDCVFTNDGTASGGFLCEGTTANANEQLYLFPSSDGADTTNFFALGASDGDALAGDSATAFFDAGEVEDARIVDALTVTGGTISASSITWTQSVAPTPTAEGVCEWETDDDHLLCGDAIDQVEFVPTEDISGDATMTVDGVIEVTQADALETDPVDCGANTWATTIAANGNLTCTAISGGAGITDATVTEADLASEDYGDFTCGAGADDCLIDANAVALTTDTTGNYVADVTAGLGLTENITPGEGASGTISIDYSQTIGGNPALAVDTCIFGSAVDGGGILCEGSTADTNEQYWRFPDINTEVAGYLVTDANDQVTSVDGAGLQVIAGGMATASTEFNFLTDGGVTSLTCGASNQGKMQVMDSGELQYCDGATTSVLKAGVPTQSGLTWNVTAATCTGDGNGGALTVNGSNQIICSADDGGAGGSGDAIEIEDGDNLGTFTAIDTTARFDDSGDINFTFADGGAGGPDTVTATVRADSVALTTDTTGNYLSDVTAGLGLTESITPGEGASGAVSIDHAQTLAGNPALNVDECIHVATAGGGGFLCEGSTADTSEQLYLFPDVNGADTTDTIAVLASPAFTGDPTAPTAAADDSDTSIATTAYVQGEINGAGGTNLTCASGTCNVDDAFLLNTGDTLGTGDLVINGVEVDFENGAAEGFPLLAQSTTPPTTACDAAGEAGRLYFDTDLDTNGSVVVCTGAGGWKDIDDDGAAGGSPGGSNTQMQYNNSSAFGGAAGLTYDNSTGVTSALRLTEGASVQSFLFRGSDRTTPTNNDEAYFTLQLEDNAPGFSEFARITWGGSDVVSTSKDGFIDFAVQVANTLTDVARVDGTGITVGTVTDAADAGGIRLENNVAICTEASPTGTDVCMQVDSTETLTFTGLAGVTLPSAAALLVATDGFLTVPQGTAPVVSGATGRIAVDTTNNGQLLYRDDGGDRVLSPEYCPSIVVENLAAADDNIAFGASKPYPITVTRIGVHCDGTCSTAADIDLSDRGGTAMTHGAPTVSTGTGNTTFTSVTAANGLVAGEGLEFSVANAVSPETDRYTITVCYTIDRE